jgi:hypothetical protein
MSESRPKGRKKAAETSAKALAGHTSEAWGIDSFWINVGRIILKPDTKNSYSILTAEG